MTEPHWKILASTRMIDNPYLSVRCDRVRLPDNTTELDWYVIEGTDSVSVFALTPAREVVLIKIYRHALGRWVYELPSGGVAPGSTPHESGMAELAEETGWRAASLDEIGRFAFQPAHTARVSHVFFTDAIAPGLPTGTEVAEADIETVLVPLPRLIEMLQGGEIAGMPTALAIYHVLAAKQLWPR